MTIVATDSPSIQAYLVTDQELGKPAVYGIDRLVQAIESRGISTRHDRQLPDHEVSITFVVGTTSGSPLARALAGDRRPLPRAPESLAFRPMKRHGSPIVVIVGADDRGLSYALLEAARRIELAAPEVDLAELFPVDEDDAPELAIRSVCIFPHNAELEREWFYSREFWEDYFARLALNRFNAFSLTFGHQTAYLTPMYPFFVDVPEYPEVIVPGLSPEDRTHNLDALRMISTMADERGIDFTLGIWQQHAYEYGKSTVEGLTRDNLEGFCATGIRRVLEACPAISGVQLRVNSESGILLDEGARFWRGIFAGIKACGRSVRLDVRAKAITDDTIQAARDTGLPVIVSTKYWTEHQGLPYHAAELQFADRLVRRHSYGDLLRHPRSYAFLFRLWNLGTNKFLLWGSSSWLRRFAESCHLGQALGFEVCAPLSNRGFRNVGGYWRLFVDRNYESYRWEMQRYWYWYTLFGRIGYNSTTPKQVWQREFAARFGAAAKHVETAYETASEFLPLITAGHSPSASVFGYWPELDTGGLLDYYLEVEPSDVARFYSVQEYVTAYLKDDLRAKETPSQLSTRFITMADAAEEAIRAAEETVGDEGRRELRGTQADVRVQAALARYHAHKLLAAEGLAFFYATGDYSMLRRAKADVQNTVEAWERLVQLTDGVYHDNLVFGREPEQLGHWKDNLISVRHDQSRVAEVAEIFRRYGLFDLGFDFGAAPERIGGPWTPRLTAEYSIEPRFIGVFPETRYTSERGYGWHAGPGLAASAAPTITASAIRGFGRVSNVLPRGMLYADSIRRSAHASYDTAAFIVDLANGLYDVTFVMADQSETPASHGPMWITLQGRQRTEAFTVPAGEIVEQRVRVPVRNGRLEAELGADPSSRWIITAMIVTRVAPHFGHVPIRHAQPSSRIPVTATVTGPEPIRRVSLYHRSDSAGPYVATSMSVKAEPIYEAFLPTDENTTQVQYYLEAEDTLGNVATYPKEGKAAPISVAIGMADRPPVVEHQPVRSCQPGVDLPVKVKIMSQAPLRWVKLYYRDLNQKEPYVILDMENVGGDYAASIPGEDVTPSWDLMYYIEASDILGNMAVYPDPEVGMPYVVVDVVRNSSSGT